MGRLKGRGLPCRLGRAPSRLRSGQASTEIERNRKRDAAQHWRAWYKTARWQRLRRSVLERDNWTCVQSGVLLVGKHPAANSPVVDHIRPHHGDPSLFWDEGNLQTVSKGWHDKVKQALEARDR
jgi:5-methylcytosine-specific restriction endonuclease McrA